MQYIQTKVVGHEVIREERRKIPRDILLFLEDPPSTRNREIVALRELLNCVESFFPPRSVRKFYVTRQGYSKAHILLKNFFYHGGDERLGHDYWYPLKNLKEMTLDRRYWFGIISDAQAVREINKITMSKKESFPYIVYCPAYFNRNGNWRILFKYPRDPKFYAFNQNINERLKWTEFYTPEQLEHYPDIIKRELDIVEREICIRKWGIPDEEEMKISFHTPGALTYLREAKSAYVWTDETPKEMMKRVKKEARETAKKEQEEKKRRKQEKRDLRDEEERKEEEKKRAKKEKKEQEKLALEGNPVEEHSEGGFDKEVREEISLINDD